MVFMTNNMAEQPQTFIPEITLGHRLYIARHTRQPTPARNEFAEELGITASSYANWESDRSVPRNLPEIAKAVEHATGVAADWIVFGDFKPGKYRSTKWYRTDPYRPGSHRPHGLPLRIHTH